jgi:putative endonuclease
MRQLYVYILSSRSRTLYVGVTNNLRRRMTEHRSKKSKFSARYRIHRLVYYEQLGPPIAAIAREKQIKRWTRKKRIELIQSMNPAWNDLAEGWFKFPWGTGESSTRAVRTADSSLRSE